MPRSLDLNRLRQFDPTAASDPVAEGTPPPTPAAAAPEPYRWPSREPQRDGQVSIKAPIEVIERFRAMCRDDRRTYADMLGILMDRYEGRGPK
ncbi:hypothetical protein JANAI61_37450 [Jannaschia sp. AI_61]|uniref:ribbon-helix-helix protein n=1 Tax=Jannaschia sp. AI_61 TaxID=2829796 RepID=UPI001BBC2347|nr:hypothetical protein [Jannaschia sp. AI_61]GIT93287.1 hypothetical protein JANAI61_37450 [Jannaschia sp. AI_61]